MLASRTRRRTSPALRAWFGAWLAAIALCAGEHHARADDTIYWVKPRAPDVAREPMRFRVGFNFNGGAIVTPAEWGGGGFAVRAGVQTGRLYSLYAQVMPLLFAKAAYEENEVRRGLLGLVPISLLSSFTPLDWLEIAAGPSLVYAGATVNTIDAGSTQTATDTTEFFGVASRFAFHASDRDPATGARGGLTIGLDPHVVVIEGSLVLLVTAGFGADWY